MTPATAGVCELKGKVERFPKPEVMGSNPTDSISDNLLENW